MITALLADRTPPPSLTASGTVLRDMHDDDDDDDSGRRALLHASRAQLDAITTSNSPLERDDDVITSGDDRRVALRVHGMSKTFTAYSPMRSVRRWFWRWWCVHACDRDATHQL
jgi:hypothetical protein